MFGVRVSFPHSDIRYTLRRIPDTLHNIACQRLTDPASKLTMDLTDAQVCRTCPLFDPVSSKYPNALLCEKLQAPLIHTSA